MITLIYEYNLKKKVHKMYDINIDIVIRVFNKKFTYQMHINKERTTITQGAHVSLVRNSLHSSLSLLVKSFEEEI